MRWIVLVFCANFLLNFGRAQNCQLEGVSEIDWDLSFVNAEVDDIERLLFRSFASTDVTAVSVTTTGNNEAVYFEAAYENNVVLVRPTSAFENFERDTASAVTPRRIGVNLVFTCTTGIRNLRFEQPIRDTNNNDPTFNSGTYSYTIPMPFPQNVDVSLFDLEITATDYDISNMRVAFSIEPQGDFAISYDEVIDDLGKVHKARLTAARPLRLTEPKTYTISVTDEGIPARTTSANLQIFIDEEASMRRSPTFENAYYLTAYSVENGENTVDISFPVDLYGSTGSVSLSGDYEDRFSVSLVGETVTVRLPGELSEEELEEIALIPLTVQVTVEGAEYPARSTLIVTIPQSECPTTTTETTTTVTTTTCPETTTVTECNCEICTTPEACPETTTVTECSCEICTTPEACPETTTVTECNCEVCTTPEITTCPETTTVTECPETTTEACECPETDPPEICTTPEPTVCPPDNSTVTECPCDGSTTEPTECPDTSSVTPSTPETCEPCPETSTTVTECPDPDCSMCPPTGCPETSPPPDCPETSTPIECPETSSPGDCPEVCTTPETSTPIDCSGVCTTPETSTPIDCPDVCTTPETSTPIDCSEICTTPETSTPLDCSGICTTPETTDCPVNCSECSTTPPENSDTTPADCPQTDCPETDCPNTPEITTPTDCPETECPIECTTSSATTPVDCPLTDCPNCTTDCPETSPVACTDPQIPSECTTPEITTDCPLLDCSLCSTTTAPSNPENLQFEQSEYKFLYPPVHEIDEYLVATSDTEEDILYALTNNPSGPYPTALTFDTATGHLSNDGYLPSGIYQLLATATGQQSNGVATAQVLISVGSAQICEDGSPRTGYSFVAVSIPENQNSVVLLKGDIEDYNYCIESQYPATNEEIFYINPDTGDLESYAMDREAELFSGMDAAQFTVTLRLRQGSVTSSSCGSATAAFSANFMSANATRSIDYRQCLYMDDQIFNEADKTIVAVIVEDVNDNAPVFAPNELVVGYPIENLSSVISAPYISQVEATDADIGDNAALVYSADNTRVYIHPLTGVLYPSDQLFSAEGDFEISVTARDENGNGLTSEPLRVELKFLEQHHISVLTLANVLPEDMDSRLNEIYMDTNILIRSLTTSVLPSTDVPSRQREAVNNFLVIVGYALDQDSELVTSISLQELLENVQGLEITPLPDSGSSGDNNDDDDDHSHVGWIVAISVLAVLLFLVIIGFIALYYFRFRKPKSYTQMDEDAPSPAPQFQKKTKLEYTGSKSSVNISERRSTGFTFAPPLSPENGETETDGSPNDDIKEQRRKSVSFNTNVEQIDIEREADNESENKQASTSAQTDIKQVPEIKKKIEISDGGKQIEEEPDVQDHRL